MKTSSDSTKETTIEKEPTEIVEIPSDQVDLEVKREKDLDTDEGPCDLSGEPLTENAYIILFSSDITPNKDQEISRLIKEESDSEESTLPSENTECSCSKDSSDDMPSDMTIAIINKILDDKIMVKPLKAAAFNSTKDMLNTYYNVSNKQVVILKEASSYEEAVSELYKNTDYYNVLREMFFLNKLIN